VFPEGTRSFTDRVQRFHKGAFFIAEKLGLDLVPLIIHGAHYTMSKGDWMLKNGQLNVYVIRASHRILK
jgi:1-acyl-sn-glycerol-3-phosphate acyltransferase